ncbi:hypothetical protein GM418_25375 [Maribellus comscasis]|uniref:Uncharacterized protein n=1 Tax=Maribellus comscasis TaxID=2681766 RepID=A0A6I6K0B4_9BACT|nr:hypothetical protein [Maribellus comscasis]QGY46868.1 hypothetical protein GM418_25375 [Maribellus comscasis]
MLRFFSKIHYKLVTENRVAKYLCYATGEKLLVVPEVVETSKRNFLVRCFTNSQLYTLRNEKDLARNINQAIFVIHQK